MHLRGSKNDNFSFTFVNIFTTSFVILKYILFHSLWTTVDL